jgi:hypothetical protein
VLLLRVSPAVLDLNEFRSGRYFAVDMCSQFGLIAFAVEALVAPNITEERGIMSATARACGASASSRVEGGVFEVERSICKGKIKIVLYPRGNVLGG